MLLTIGRCRKPACSAFRTTSGVRRSRAHRPGRWPIAVEADIIGFVGERLAGYKKPKSVEFVDALPKTTYGKLDKRTVRAPYWAGQDRMVR